MPMKTDAVDQVAQSIIKSIEAFNEAKMAPIKFQNQMLMKQYENKLALENEDQKNRMKLESDYKYDPMKRAQLAAMASQYPEMAPELERFGIKAPKQPDIQVGSQTLPSGVDLQKMAQGLNATPTQRAITPLDSVINNIYNKSIQGQPLSMGEAKMIKKSEKPPLEIISPLSGKIIENPEYKIWEKANASQGGFNINNLKIDEGDRDLLVKVSNARRSGEQLSKDDIISNMSPELAVSVQGLLDYNDDPAMYSTRNNARAEMIRVARMTDPTYDPTKYAERRKYRLELASESSLVGKQKIALNTVAQHMQQLDGYIDALGGGNIKPQNMVINFAKDMTGDPSIARYEQANEAVMSEMQRLLTGVGVTQAGMAEARKIVDRNTGYEAKKQALKSLVKIVEGRITPLRQSFKQKMGRDENGEIVFPETQAIFDKYVPSTSSGTTSNKLETLKSKYGLE